jgi:hypothetical protein
MIQLLSFDVGTTNMAYCFSICDNDINNDNENKDFKVININKIDLNIKKSNIQNIIDNTIEFLDELMTTLSFDINSKMIILIECQMTSIMRTIQTCINTYFKVIGRNENMDIDTIYVSPKHKLKLMDITSDTVMEDKYKQNKFDSIFFTSHLLKTTFKDDKILDIINSFKKKDDLCDAFLMCVYYYSEFYKK